MDYKDLYNNIMKNLTNEPEDFFMLAEKLITFGGKAYPKFNNIVIIAGGAGVGKGFTLQQLMGIEGKVFDVDKLKSFALRSSKIIELVKKETGKDISKLNLKNPDDVVKLHGILGIELKIGDKEQKKVFSSILLADPDRKPNLIFDVTLKSVNKLHKIYLNMQELGYNKENIHIVWVLNSVDVALAQNKERDRVVPTDILIQTHEGVSLTMKKLLSDANTLRKFMDGDFWISANMKGVDTQMKFSGRHGKRFDGAPGVEGSYTKGGSYISDTNYWKIKKQGQAPMSISDFEDVLMNKIKDYTPKIDAW